LFTFPLGCAFSDKTLDSHPRESTHSH
jgi:hypothetical protein